MTEFESKLRAKFPNAPESFFRRQMAGIPAGIVASRLGQTAADKTKRIRQSSKPLMNKLEAEYCAILLRSFSPDQIFIQALRFRLGNGIWYKPDFVVMDLSWNKWAKCFEIKGPHAFRGGFENLKVAAGMYKNFDWELRWKKDGVWREQRILP